MPRTVHESRPPSKPTFPSILSCSTASSRGHAMLSTALLVGRSWPSSYPKDIRNLCQRSSTLLVLVVLSAANLRTRTKQSHPMLPCVPNQSTSTRATQTPVHYPLFFENKPKMEQKTRMPRPSRARIVQHVPRPMSPSPTAVILILTTSWQDNPPNGGHPSPLPFSAVHPRRIPRARSHELALAIGRRLVRVLRLFNLANQQLKRARHVLAVARAGLGPRALVALGERLALLGCDLALLGAEVGFVADDADGDGVCALFLGGWLVDWLGVWGGEGGCTRWLRILSRMTWTISKVGLDDTE